MTGEAGQELKGPIADFVSNCRAKSTLQAYRASVFSFLDFIYQKNHRKGKNATPEEQSLYSEVATRYLSEGRDYTNDFLRYIKSIREIPPLTVKLRYAAINEFFKFHDIELTKKQLGAVRSQIPLGNTRTVERDIEHETVKTLVAHMDVRGRALCLVLASSGMRIGETLQLRLTDIDLVSEPSEITIRQEYTKTKMQRFTFISKEATIAVREWLKVRDKYLVSAENRNAGLIGVGIGKAKSIHDDHLFPFSTQTASQMWETALKNADLYSLDPSTGRKQIHPHMLRKFFRSQLAMSCPVDIVEALMGHAGYLTDAYRRISKAQMKEAYLKNEFRVTIQAPRELQEISNNFENKMAAHSDLIVHLSNENLQLKNQIGMILRDVERMKYLTSMIESDPRFPALADPRSA